MLKGQDGSRRAWKNRQTAPFLPFWIQLSLFAEGLPQQVSPLGALIASSNPHVDINLLNLSHCGQRFSSVLFGFWVLVHSASRLRCGASSSASSTATSLLKEFW
jgi:hypothetical protein